MQPPKTKTRVVPGQIRTIISRRDPQGALTSLSDYIYSFTNASSTIWCTRYPRPQFNNCTHSRFACSRSPITDMWTYANKDKGYATGIFGSYKAPGLPSLDYDWGGAYAALLDDAYGVVPSNESFLVNLAELSELRDLAPNLLQGLADLPKLYRSTKFKMITFRDLAGSHLAVEFGLLPLLGDLKAFIELAAGVRQKLLWMENVERQERYPFTAKTEKVPFSISTTYPDAPASGLTSTHDEVARKGTCVGSGQGSLRCFGKVELHHEAAREVRGWLSSVGLLNPLAVVWELIPFSFVLDWFFPLGKAISRAALPRALGSMAKSVEFWQPSHSIKVEYINTYSSKYQVQSAIGSGGLNPTYFISVARKSYERYLGWPGVDTLPVSPDWTFRRTAIAGSLLITQSGRGRGGTK